MQNEIVKKPMVDVLTEITGEQVVMDGDRYIALKDGADIGDDFVADAIERQEELYQETILNKRKAEALAYLSTTDWYAIRQQETGKLTPSDILEARSKCREILR
jgi:hypothetical protein